MTNYSITKERCEQLIHGVCSQCGGELRPFETEDNAGNPTFWAGCEPCSRFDWGCDPEVHRIARALADSGEIIYTHMESPLSRDGDEEYKKYYLDSQTAGWTHIVSRVLKMAKSPVPESTQD